VPEFYIGRTRIQYEIQLDARFSRKRLTIVGDKIFLQSPEGTSERDAEEFLVCNQKWIYEKLREAKENPLLDPWPERFVPGAKVLWNGRWEPIRISEEKEHCETIEIAFMQGFRIFLPCRSVDRRELIRAFEDFFRAPTILQSPEIPNSDFAEPA
jgi:predicted metal-dependent hydrolase